MFSTTPSLPQLFSVILSNAQGGAFIGPNSAASFSIIEHDSPYGQCYLTTASLLSQPSGFADDAVAAHTHVMQRIPAVLPHIARLRHFWRVAVTYSVLWVPANGSASIALPCGACSATVAAGTANIAALYQLPSWALLRAGDTLTVTLATATLLATPQGSLPPVIDFMRRSAQAAATAATSDSVVQIAAGSLSISTAKGSAFAITLQRQSTRGVLVVQWAANASYFLANQGSAIFAAGASTAVVNITVVQDNVPQLAKWATITLTNFTTSGTALAGVGPLTATIFITDSNTPFGVFAIANVTGGQAGTGLFAEGSVATVTITRTLGVIGAATVLVQLSNINASSSYYSVLTSLYLSPFNANTYQLTFLNGQTSATIPISILVDQTPKLTSTFSVALTGASTQYPNPLSAPQVAVQPPTLISIAPSNNPYGRYGWQQLAYSTAEGSTYSFTVVRLDGSFGTVAVNWAAVPATGIVSTLIDGKSGRVPATPDVPSLAPTSGTAVFAPGQLSQTVAVSVLSTQLAQPARQVQLVLTGASLGAPIQPSLNTTTLSIAAANYPGGVFAFGASIYTSSEAQDAVTINIERTAGLFWPAVVSWQLSALGLASLDIFPVTNGTASFATGQTSAQLSINVVPNGVFEDLRVFALQLATSSAGAAVGAAVATLSIAKDTGANGVFEFSCAEQFGHVLFGASANAVNVTVTRSQGTIGAVAVQISTTDLGTAIPGVEFVPSTQLLSFDVGETTQFALFETKPLKNPLTSKTLVVALSDATGGASVGAYNLSTIALCDSNQTRILLAAAEVALCDPLAYVSPQPSPSSTPYQLQDATVAAIADSIAALLQLNDDSTSSAGEVVRRVQAIKDLFAQTMDPSAAADVTTFGRLPALMEQFAQWLLSRFTVCPGSGTQSVTAHATAVYQRVSTEQNLNDLQLDFGNASIQLPPNAFHGLAACPGVAAVTYTSDVWFPLNQTYFVVNSPGSPPIAVVDPLISVLQHTVVALVPPPGLQSAALSLTNAVTFSVAFAGNSALQVENGPRVCVAWDFALNGGGGGWSTLGCVETSHAPSAVVTCACNHATNYAVLVHVQQYKSLSAADKAGLIVLLVAIVLVLGLQFAFGAERTIVHSMLLHFFLTLAVSLLIVVVDMFTANTVSQQHCSAEALILHYFLLAHSAWLALTFWHARNVIVLGKDPFGAWKIKHLLLGYGAPVVVIVLYIAIYTPTHGSNFADTYGFTGEQHEFCMMPSFNAGGLVGALAAPYLSSIPLAALVLVLCKRHRRIDWTKPGVLYFERSGFDELLVQFGLFVGVVIIWMFLAADILLVSAAFQWFVLGLCIIMAAYVINFYGVLPKLAVRERKAAPAPVEVIAHTHRMDMDAAPLASFAANSIKVVSNKQSLLPTALAPDVLETEYVMSAPVRADVESNSDPVRASDDEFDAINRVLGTTADEPDEANAAVSVNRNNSRRISITDTHL